MEVEGRVALRRTYRAGATTRQARVNADYQINIQARGPYKVNTMTTDKTATPTITLRHSEGVKNISILDMINPINGKKIRDGTGHEVAAAGEFYIRMAMVKRAQSAEGGGEAA